MVRSFSGAPVPADVLEGLIAWATSAPSAGNTAGWEAVVLVGRDQTQAFWEATTTDDWRRRSRRWPGLSRAPVVVAIFVRVDAYLARYGEPDKAASGLDEEQAWPVPYWFVDGGFAALLLLLAATDAHLSACFLGNFRGEAALKTALGVPEDRRYLGAVCIGDADGGDAPSPSASRGRRQPSQVFHRGRW